MQSTTFDPSLRARVLDYFLPRNAITGSRQVQLLPNFVEHFFQELTRTPPGGYHVSERKIEFIGRDGKKRQLEMELLVEEIGNNLTQQIGYKTRFKHLFNVSQGREINAYTSFGGNISITANCVLDLINRYSEDTKEAMIEGIRQHFPDATQEFINNLTNLTHEDLIAAVLAHEIVHAESRDMLQGMHMKYGLYTFLAIWFRGNLERAVKHIDSIYRMHFVSKIFEFLWDCLKEAVNLVKKLPDDFLKKFVSHLHLNVLISYLACRLLIMYVQRSHETRCDLYGMEVLVRAGYKPEAMMMRKYISSLKHPKQQNRAVYHLFNAFSTHPCDENRVRACYEALSRLSNAPESESHPQGPIRIYGSERTLLKA